MDKNNKLKQIAEMSIDSILDLMRHAPEDDQGETISLIIMIGINIMRTTQGDAFTSGWMECAIDSLNKPLGIELNLHLNDKPQQE